MENYLTERSWIITEMTYKDENLRPYLTSNVLFFWDENNCTIPYVAEEVKFLNKNDKKAKWFLTGNNTLKIESVKEYINGEFQFCFRKDHELKAVYIIIKSKDFYLKAYKGQHGKGYSDSLPLSCDGA